MPQLLCDCECAVAGYRKYKHMIVKQTQNHFGIRLLHTIVCHVCRNEKIHIVNCRCPTGVYQLAPRSATPSDWENTLRLVCRAINFTRPSFMHVAPNRSAKTIDFNFVFCIHNKYVGGILMRKSEFRDKRQPDNISSDLGQRNKNTLRSRRTHHAFGCNRLTCE